MSRLSVIIPAYNTHELTAIHVKACMEATRVPDEIIVVNDGGTEDLKDKLLALKPFNTKIIYARVDQDITWNYNGACNLGVWISTGDYIILEDSDHIPGKEAYENGIKILDTRPELSRVGYNRRIVPLDDVLHKPFERWDMSLTHIGTNVMVQMLRRELYITLKGQDERMCGRYGWMGHDWARRRDTMAGCKGIKSQWFYLVKDGSSPNMVRGMSRENVAVYRDNMKFKRLQPPRGILNFTYSYAVL